MLIVLVAAFGLVVGSFLSVVVSRLHAGQDFVKGRSACPHCGHELQPLDLVPLASWLLLRGRCRYCKVRIPLQDPLVELLTAVVFVAAYLALQPHDLVSTVRFGLWLYVLGSLIVLAVYDLRWYLLPDKVLLPLILPAAALDSLSAASAHSIGPIYRPALAGLLFGGIFYLIAVLSKGKGMGGGDIKLAFVMGLLLGVKKTALAMLVAFNLAAVVSLVLIGLRLRRRKDPIPFGPFLILGTLIAFLYGDAIINWYISFSQIDLLWS